MAQPIEQEKEVNPATLTGEMEVIIIDDDPLFRLMLQDYLLEEGIGSELFDNGITFLEKYKAGDFRKIILDYEFGMGPDGLTVLKKIIAINPLARIIVVSGVDDLEKAVETIRYGATDYFLKTSTTVFANILCSLIKLRQLEKLKLN